MRLADIIQEDSFEPQDTGIHEVEPLDLSTDEYVEPSGGFLDPCQENGDCWSGYCIQTVDGKVCTILCTEECPMGWTCGMDRSSLPDVNYLCVPEILAQAGDRDDLDPDVHPGFWPAKVWEASWRPPTTPASRESTSSDVPTAGTARAPTATLTQPGGDTIYDLGQKVTDFRMGWGE